MRQIYEKILDLIYPPLCLYCEAEIVDYKEVLCLSCRQSLPYLSRNRGEDYSLVSERMNRLIPLEQAYSCFYSSHNNIVQVLIKLFKYQHHLVAGKFLSFRMAEDFVRFCSSCQVSFDLIIPVPIHKKKQRKRGYNQSEVISDIIAQAIHTPVRKDLLMKIKATDSQTHKSRDLRMHVSEEVFRVNKYEELNGLHMLLIDDILTTGATIEKCVNALRRVYPQARFSIATLALSMFR